MGFLKSRSVNVSPCNKKSGSCLETTSRSVGMTRLELATSSPTDVCATNCATSRYSLLILISECKGMVLF